MGLATVARSVRNTRAGDLFRRIVRGPVGQVVGLTRFERSFGIATVTGEKPDVAADRGPAPPVDDGTLQRRYVTSQCVGTPDTFVLYRIIGNDLVPRHRKGQSRENVKFILEHEPDLPQCETRWVLNRIVDQEEERAIRRLLDEHHQPYLTIPFSYTEYSRAGWDLSALPQPGYTLSRRFAELPADFRSRLLKRLYRYKNNYAINNNGARNAALADGKTRAKWVLPWDGNCFLTPEAWREIRTTITARPWYPYAVVPMARARTFAELQTASFSASADQEPQLVFRADASATFDESFYYGRRPKVELLWRLGVPGPWDQWAVEPWDLPVPDYCADAGAWQWAGWVARLPSGRAALDVGRGSESRRLTARADAVLTFLRGLDAEVLRRNVLLTRPVLPAIDAEGTAESLAVLTRLTQFTRRSSPQAHSRRITVLRRMLSVHWSLPFVLDAGETPPSPTDLDMMLDWLLTDGSARRLAGDRGIAGTVYTLLTLVLARLLGRSHDLAILLLPAADRVSVSVPYNSTHRVLLEALMTCVTTFTPHTFDLPGLSDHN